ncbi:MAG: hypothetical protein VYD71_02275 [Bacteroidota bacterium]|nr:hypothetical protein [Bacteroidota bacterium]
MQKNKSRKKEEKNTPAACIQDLQFLGEFGGVNPSFSDSSTFSYLAEKNGTF